MPIFKKGDLDETDNYLGITLMSCMLKIFTTILNNRLMKWSDRNSVITDAQFGYRLGVGTLYDTIFALQSIIDKHLSNIKKLYCCFVYYRKAFDSIHKNYFVEKLITIEIRGKCLRVYHPCTGMSGVVLNSKYKNNFSDLFQCRTRSTTGRAVIAFTFFVLS